GPLNSSASHHPSPHSLLLGKSTAANSTAHHHKPSLNLVMGRSSFKDSAAAQSGVVVEEVGPDGLRKLVWAADFGP
ncbi:hypothetical protein Drorol1_Dr00004928, partial [Drosera rotundifolia]